MGIFGDLSAILIGLVLLFAGQRFFWLAGGLIGFLFGFNIFSHFFDVLWLNLVVGLALGLVFGWLAMKFIKWVAYFVGAFAGAVALPMILGFFGVNYNWLLMFSFGAIIGLVLIIVSFDWGLILLTALVGASMIAHNLQDMITFSDTIRGIIAVVLLVLGVAAQAAQKKGK